MTYGIKDTGFALKDFDTILSEIKASLQVKYGDVLITDTTVLGQISNIAAEALALEWEALEGVYNAGLISGAEGVNLDALLLLNNLTRQPATKSKIPNATITGTASTIIPAGFRVKASSSTSLIWETLQEYTVAGGGTVSADFYCTTTGANDLSVSQLDTIVTPVTNITDITNSEVTEIGDDIESDVEFLNRRSNRIANSIGGSHDGIYNAIDKLNDDETTYPIDFIHVVSNRTSSTDGAGRPPHSFELYVEDVSTLVLRGVDKVGINNGATTAVVDETYTNMSGWFSLGDTIVIESDFNDYTSLTTSPYGGEKFTLTAMSDAGGGSTNITLNAAYKGSNDAAANLYSCTNTKDTEVAEALFTSMPAGILSNGTANITVTDTFNNEHIIQFSHPEPVPIYLDLTLTVTSALTSEEESQVKADISAWGNALGIGKDVIVFGYNCLVAQLNNEKITDVVVDIGTAPGPSGDANVSIDDGSSGEIEYSTWSTTNISIT